MKYKDLIITEAKNDYWKRILKGADEKRIKESRFSMTDTVSSFNFTRLDPSSGGIYNFQNIKGKSAEAPMYELEEFRFVLKITNVFELIIYSLDNIYLERIVMPMKKGLDTMIKGIKILTERPTILGGVIVSPFDTITVHGKHAYFHLKNGAKKEVWLGNKGAIETKAYILRAIEELEDAGAKVTAKAKKLLPVLLPEVYNQAEFKLDNTILKEFDKFEKDKLYQKFVNGMDNESRTGWGITVREDEIYVHGMVGNTSSGYEGKRFKFKKAPTSYAQLKSFMKKEGIIDYIVDLSSRIFGEMNRYTNYMKNGGAID